MRRTLSAVVSVLLLVVAPTIDARAQTRPDLSGTWRPASGGPQSAADPFELSIVQTAESVTFRIPGQLPEESTVRFDGQETRIALATRGGQTEMVWRGSWDGPRLVVSTTITSAGRVTSSRQSFSVDAGRLSVETTNTTADVAPTPPRTSTYAKIMVSPLGAPPSRQVEAGFSSLFNGKDLTGWRAGGSAESFTVQNGAIVARGVNGAAHLFYDGLVGNHAFRNFELRLDVVARYRSNGGIYIMTEFQPQGFPAKGFEVQVNNSHTDRIRSGSLYHVVDLSHIPAKDDEWYPMVMRVQGDTITINLKGQDVVRWVQPPDWNGSYDFVNRRIAPGTIAFQAHDSYSVSAYANIRIRELP